ncbi:MAG: iron-sulfur cluster biosynthesis family protein [Nitrospiraceae bacterium]
MIKVTQSAVQHLKALILAHPEDPVVRVQVQDLDDHRLTFNITLEDKVQPDDEAQIIDGLTIAAAGASAARLDGITMDYQEPGGFKFHHADPQDDFRLDLINLN